MESRVPIAVTRSLVLVGLLLFSSGVWAEGRSSHLRVASSALERDLLATHLQAELAKTSPGLALEWTDDTGKHDPVRDLLEGGADIALTAQRARPEDVGLAERFGLALHEHAVALDDHSVLASANDLVESDSVAEGEPTERTLWLYSVGTSGYVRRLLDFLRLQGGRRVLEDVGLQPLLAETPRHLEQEAVGAELTRVRFGYRGFRLGAEVRQVLDRLAESLKDSRRVWIVGHAEPTESSDEGDLSLLRARQVADYLERRGVDPSRMTVEGVGVSEPLTTHRTLEGRRESRRAEIWVLPRTPQR
jgi:outer membrane protein OmpA-like peptidoglycan-associated protein